MDGEIWSAAPLLLAVALLLDARFGAEAWAWARGAHPTALLSSASASLEAAFGQIRSEARGKAGAARMAGALSVAALAAAAAALGYALESTPVAGPVLAVLATALLIAQKSLIERVEKAAQRLAAAARAVGRRTREDAQQETLAARRVIESCADGFATLVVAPAFWFLVGGLAGVFAYQAAHAAARTVGRRPETAAFGSAARGLDAVLTWIPKRIAALLIAVASPLRGRALTIALRDAGHRRGGENGWPAAAMAGGLGVALAGPTAPRRRCMRRGARSLARARCAPPIGVAAHAWILLVSGLLLAVCGQIALEIATKT